MKLRNLYAQNKKDGEGKKEKKEFLAVALPRLRVFGAR